MYVHIPSQHAGYSNLFATLKDRFTPVQIQSIQSSIFHKRKKLLTTASIDNYAQDLRKLYSKAYSNDHEVAKKLGQWGRSVLVYRFVAGLLPHLKSKFAGNDGRFEELL